jgi:hypothetical protein
MAEVDRGGVTPSNFDQRLTELRTYAQSFSSPHTRDIVNNSIGLIQLAWTIERQGMGTGAQRSTTTEQQRNDR